MPADHGTAWSRIPVPGKTPQERWPDVTNPVALRILDRLYRSMPHGVHRGPAFDDPEKCTMELHDYQMWLHDRLRSSGLAKALAGGPEFLADASEHLTQPWRWIARLLAPRSYEQLALRVRNNLEWYVDQSRPIIDPLKKLESGFWPSLGLALLLQLAQFYCRGMQVGDWIAFLGETLLIIAVLLTASLLFGGNTLKHHTNAAELFWYLLEQYSEPRRTGSESPEDDGESLSALAHFDHRRPQSNHPISPLQ